MTKTLNILIADDDPVISAILHDLLSQQYAVQMVANGKEAWQRLELDDSIGMVICDIHMPQLDGMELLRRVRKSYPKIGVIVISGSSDTKTAVSALRLGAYDYICKPFSDIEELTLIIQRWEYQQSLEAKLIQYADLHLEMMQNMKIRTFLALDVVGSKNLKSGEDPFLVQFSFGEYQKFLAEIVAQSGGQIHNTSGDGTMTCFKAASEALNAGRKILQKMETFNQELNRLRNPFVLRLAAHTGPVLLDGAGKISETYAETLDIAGHIQKTAEPNTLEISSTTREAVGDSAKAVLTDKLIDGYSIYSVTRD